MTNPTEPGGRVVPTWNLADRLRKVRRDVLDLTQDEMAAQLEVGAKRYAAWETGQNKPSDLVALSIRLESLSGVSAVWFVFGETDEAPAPRPPTSLLFDEGTY